MANDAAAPAAGMDNAGASPAAGAAPADNAAPAGGQAPAWKGIGIPDHMLKDTAEDTLVEVFKGLKGYRDKDAQQGPVGKSADDYKFEFADELKPYFPNNDDPALKAFQNYAHKKGMPIKMANDLVNEVFGPLAKEGKLPQPFNPKAELDGIAKLLGKSGAEAGPAIEQATVEMEGWAKNFGQQLKLSDGAQVELESLMLSANGFELLQKLQGGGGAGFKLGGSTPGVLSKEEVFAMANDPRANPNSPKYDESYVARYKAEYEALRQREARR